MTANEVAEIISFMFISSLQYKVIRTLSTNKLCAMNKCHPKAEKEI
jgi:hypothetical protein